MAYAVHALLPVVIDVSWATLPEPEEIQATARWPDVLRRTVPEPDWDRLHKVFQELSASPGIGSGVAPRTRGRPPCRLLVAGHRFPLRRPLRRPGEDRV